MKDKVEDIIKSFGLKKLDKSKSILDYWIYYKRSELRLCFH